MEDNKELKETIEEIFMYKMHENYGLTEEQYKDIVRPYELMIVNLMQMHKGMIKMELANNLIKGELIKLAEQFNIIIIEPKEV